MESLYWHLEITILKWIVTFSSLLIASLLPKFLALFHFIIVPINLHNTDEYTSHNNAQSHPKVRLEYAKRIFCFSGVKSWNDIPENIREQESIARF